MKKVQWDIVNMHGKLIEGGFFSKDAALDMLQREFPNCVVI